MLVSVAVSENVSTGAAMVVSERKNLILKELISSNIIILVVSQ